MHRKEPVGAVFFNSSVSSFALSADVSTPMNSVIVICGTKGNRRGGAPVKTAADSKAMSIFSNVGFGSIARYMHVVVGKKLVSGP